MSAPGEASHQQAAKDPESRGVVERRPGPVGNLGAILDKEIRHGLDTILNLGIYREIRILQHHGNT